MSLKKEREARLVEGSLVMLLRAHAAFSYTVTREEINSSAQPAVHPTASTPAAHPAAVDPGLRQTETRARASSSVADAEKAETAQLATEVAAHALRQAAALESAARAAVKAAAEAAEAAARAMNECRAAVTQEATQAALVLLLHL